MLFQFIQPFVQDILIEHTHMCFHSSSHGVMLVNRASVQENQAASSMIVLGACKCVMAGDT